jgi:hypothetical protein
MFHLFTQCVHARQVWHLCFQHLVMAAVPPSVTYTLEEWWLRERGKLMIKQEKL